MNWVSPLVLLYWNTSSVTVNLHSCEITNSNYKNADSTNGRSAVVYCYDEYTNTQSVTFNMSFCLCLNNSFNTSALSIGGGYSYFCSYNTSSSM
jgi:hypothetical protein